MTEALDEELLKKIPYLDTTVPKTYDLTRYDSTDTWYGWLNIDLTHSVLTFGMSALLLKAFIDCKSRRSGRVFNQAAYVPFLPKAMADSNAGPGSFISSVWSMIQSLEWINFAIALLILLCLVLLIVFVLRTFRFVRKIANWMATVDEMDEYETGGLARGGRRGR